MFLMFGLLFNFAWVFEVLLLPGKSQLPRIRNQIECAPSPLPIKHFNFNFNFNFNSYSYSYSYSNFENSPLQSQSKPRLQSAAWIGVSALQAFRFSEYGFRGLCPRQRMCQPFRLDSLQSGQSNCPADAPRQPESTEFDFSCEQEICRWSA